MKLNSDCIRDILLEVEDTCDINSCIILPKMKTERLSKYSDDEIAYHVRQCDASGFFLDAKEIECNSFRVLDLSPTGHAYLANVRRNPF